MKPTFQDVFIVVRMRLLPAAGAAIPTSEDEIEQDLAERETASEVAWQLISQEHRLLPCFSARQCDGANVDAYELCEHDRQPDVDGDGRLSWAVAFCADGLEVAQRCRQALVSLVHSAFERAVLQVAAQGDGGRGPARVLLHGVEVLSLDGQPQELVDPQASELLEMLMES